MTSRDAKRCAPVENLRAGQPYSPPFCASPENPSRLMTFISTVKGTYYGVHGCATKISRRGTAGKRLRTMEASPGIEPGCKDLQSSA
jgi:hypothetical protein